MPSNDNAQQAILHFKLLNRFSQSSQLELNLETGRKHQIRVQLANQGTPILGDRKYGSTISFPHGIALHSASLRLNHPTQKQPMTFDAPLPKEWKSWIS